MPRGKTSRTIRCDPTHIYFKPRGIPLNKITGEVAITLDELESLRLTSLEGLSQEEAGNQMDVSQSTISRHLDDVYRKVAKALVHGFAIRIFNTTDFFHCDTCGYTWKLLEKNFKILLCEKCGSTKFHIHSRGKDSTQTQLTDINK
jgi:predicted DNA-binding protein (UPF0251 family)